MNRIHVNFYIHAPREKVFAAFCDHEHFFRGGGIKSARVVVEGKPDRNGLGARREVRANGMRFVEDITCCEKPGRLDYKIIECTLPMKHEGGRLDFIARGEGTEIDWKSSFEVPVLLLGSILGRMFTQALTAEFIRLGLQTKEELEGK